MTYRDTRPRILRRNIIWGTLNNFGVCKFQEAPGEFKGKDMVNCVVSVAVLGIKGCFHIRQNNLVMFACGFLSSSTKQINQIIEMFSGFNFLNKMYTFFVF